MTTLATKADRANADFPHQERLRTSVFYSTLGQAVYVAAQLGVLTAIARFAGVVAVGEFGLAMAVATPIFLLTNFGIRTGQATDVERRYSFQEYAGFALSSGVIGLGLSLAVGFSLFESSNGLAILFMVSASKAVEAISIMSYGAYQQAGRLDLSARSLCLRGIFSVLAFVGLLAMGTSVAVALLAQFVVWSLIAVTIDYRHASHLLTGRVTAPVLHFGRMYLLARENAALGFGQFLGSLGVSLPRLMLKWFIGLEAVGLFTLVYYFFQAGTMIANAVAQALVGRFAKMWLSGQVKDVHKIALQLGALGLILSGSGIMVVVSKGGAILTFIFGPEARAGESLFILIAFALALKLLDLVPQSLLAAQRRFRGFLGSQILSLATSAVLLSLLVPHWGILGAGIAVLGAAGVRLGTLSFVLIKTSRSKEAGA